MPKRKEPIVVIQTETSDPSEPRKSQAMQYFEDLIEQLVHDATPADREKIRTQNYWDLSGSGV